jgi:hypothetical protein
VRVVSRAVTFRQHPAPYDEDQHEELLDDGDPGLSVDLQIVGQQVALRRATLTVSDTSRAPPPTDS